MSIESLDAVDQHRRKVLSGVSLASVAVVSVGVATPFMASLAPSRRTKGEGAPITVDLTKVLDGMLLVVPWRRKPTWILRRTSEMLTSLDKNLDKLVDSDSESSIQPESCKNQTRSLQPEVFVAVGVCTHLGCSPGINPPDGFLCACHGSHFDYAGRVFSGSPAPTNLTIPDHFYENEDSLVIGVNSADKA